MSQENPSQSTTIQRQAVWLRSASGAQFFSWIHGPSTDTAKCVGVIIVGPIGPEYMHSHRTLRFLADELARRGFTCLRYDPVGMGNSSHDLGDNAIADHWVGTLVAARDFFKASLAIDRTVVVSLRSGALIANELLTTQSVEGAVFWYPYLKGSALVRDLQIIDSMLHMNSTATAFIEAGGYPLYPTAQDYLNSVDLLKSVPQQLTHALIINNATQPPTKKLQQVLVAQGVAVSQQDMSGLERMMKQSEITEVPEDNVAAIGSWLAQTFPDQQQNLLSSSKPGLPHTNENFREISLQLPAERPIFGVLTEALPPCTSKPLVVFVNGGSGHHVGPNRLYVDICRRLAADGFNSVRLDLSNLGDSAKDITPESHNPYALTAADDIQAALALLRSAHGYKSFIVTGLCSGAHNSFQAALALQSDAVREIILINPLAFHWRQGDSLLAPEDSQHEADAAHYSGNVRSLRKWVSLFTDVNKLRNAFGFALRLVKKKSARVAKIFLSSVGVAQHSRLERDLLAINGAGTRVTLFIGAAEPGYRLLLAQAGDTVKKQVAKGDMHIAIIEDGDHTFSSLASRKNLINLFVQQLKRYG